MFDIEVVPCEALEDQVWMLSVVDGKLQAVKIMDIGGQEDEEV
jgi:hypothetical protein